MGGRPCPIPPNRSRVRRRARVYIGNQPDSGLDLRPLQRRIRQWNTSSQSCLTSSNRGKLSQRQLIQNLALAATAAAAARPVPAAAAEGKVLKVTGINHVSYQVTDYARTRDFYTGLFDMKVSEDDGKQCRLSFGDDILVVRSRQPAPKVDHIAYTIANWDEEKEAAEAEVKRRGLKVVPGVARSSLHILDPDGLGVQFGGTLQ